MQTKRFSFSFALTNSLHPHPQSLRYVNIQGQRLHQQTRVMGLALRRHPTHGLFARLVVGFEVSEQ